MKHAKKYISLLAALAMIISLALPAGTYAAAKPKLSTKSVKVKVGAKKKVTVKKAKGYKITVKSKKKAIATAKKKGKSAFVVKGVAAGKTTVVCTAKKGKKKVTLKCKVTVSDDSGTTPPADNQNPANPSGTGDQNGNGNPPAEPTPEPTPFVFPEYDEYSTLPYSYDTEKELVPKGKTETLSYGDGSAIVVLPAKYTADKKYPVTYLLHGDGDNSQSWNSMGCYNVIYNVIGLKMAKEMIIVLPDYSGKGDDDVIKDFAENLLPAVEGKYSVETGRVNTAVAGYDKGGSLALRIGIECADKVAYAGAFAPTGGLLDGAFNDASFKFPEEYQDTTFVMIQKGKSDNVAGNAPATYSQTLTDNGTKNLYLEMDGSHGADLYKGGLYNFLRRLFPKGDGKDTKMNGFVNTLDRSVVPTSYNNISQRGKIEQVYYDTQTYDPGNSVAIRKYANVFLPYGYDPDKQYNILYLMHGYGENQETWIVGDLQTNPSGYGDYTQNQNMLNYLFQSGYCEPCIIVNPTFFRPEGAPEPANVMDLTKLFRDELRNDLIPAIEAKYHTYADFDVSEENLIATRMHRAFAGLSMGSNTTYNSALFGNYDIFAYFGPFSGFFGRNATTDEDVVELEKIIKDAEAQGMPLGFLYCGNGSADFGLSGQLEFQQKMAVNTDVLIPGQNYEFVLIPEAEHNMWQWHVHLYNILKVFFTKE